MDTIIAKTLGGFDTITLDQLNMYGCPHWCK